MAKGREEIPKGHEQIELCGGRYDGLISSLPPHINVYEKAGGSDLEWDRYVRSNRKNNAGNPIFIYVPRGGK